MLPRYWVTAARVVLVSVSINCCVTGGEKPSFIHVAHSVSTRVCTLAVGGGGALGVRRDYVLFEGGTVALYHRLGRGRR